MPRLRRVDSKKFKKLREAKWETLESFALDAIVSTDAVRRAESYGRNFLSTIKKMAKTLGVDPKDILADENDQSDLVTIELYLDMSMAESHVLSSLMREIESRVRLRSDIKKLVIRYGSVVVRLLCHCDDVAAFVNALGDNQIEDLRAKSIRLFKSDIRKDGEILDASPVKFHFTSYTNAIITARRRRINKSTEYLTHIMRPYSEWPRSWFADTLIAARDAKNLFVTIDTEGFTIGTQILKPAQQPVSV